MVSENKIASIFKFWDRSLFDLSAIEGDSPVYYHKSKK